MFHTHMEEYYIYDYKTLELNKLHINKHNLFI
jgi:hypothetical protein